MGWRLPGCNLKKLPKSPKPKFKKQHFVDTTISNVSRDLSFSRSQLQNLADDRYKRILKNVLIK
jgi:hypothetical protein